jgi:hypothetical protein
MRCLRLGHTQKFFRSKQRCSHCGNFNHGINICETRKSTSTQCLNCKLDGIATDRSYSEWTTQKEVKKIMANENKSYAKAVQIKLSGVVHRGHTYAEVSNLNKISSLIPNSVQKASSNSVPYNLPQFPRVYSQYIPTFFQNGSFLNYIEQPISNFPNSNFIAWFLKFY